MEAQKREFSLYNYNEKHELTPHKSENLKTSGIDVVLAHTLYSIVGAIALQHGGEVANRVTREKILSPLGLR